MSELADFLLADRTFVRVYRLPTELTNGYCFGAGVPITFTNVDWFEAPVAEGVVPLREFIKTKTYYRPDAQFLVLGDSPGFTFLLHDAREKDDR